MATLLVAIGARVTGGAAIRRTARPMRALATRAMERKAGALGLGRVVFWSMFGDPLPGSGHWKVDQEEEE